MPRPRVESQEAVGQDSFLDVVTNVVGIMIILVMAVGIRAKQLPAEIAEQTPPPAEKAEVAVEKTDDSTAKAAALTAKLNALQQEQARLAAAAEAARKQHDVQSETVAEVEAQTQLVEREYNRRKLLQDELSKLIAVGQVQLDEVRRRLGADAAVAEKQAEITLAKQELDNLRQQQESLLKQPQQVIELAAQGTPISKIVDGTEAHFQLRGERVAYVPLEELVEAARREMKPELDKLRTLSDVQESAEREYRTGIRRGFEMRYMLMINTDRTGNRVSIGMSRFELHPTQAMLGETQAEALQPNSQFRQDLAQLSPRSTTITLWVYADSFPLYHAMQGELRKLGYPVAGRLMPLELPIGGSPQGKRSLSQ